MMDARAALREKMETERKSGAWSTPDDLEENK
jgi:hypothetical protein